MHITTLHFFFQPTPNQSSAAKISNVLWFVCVPQRFIRKKCRQLDGAVAGRSRFNCHCELWGAPCWNRQVRFLLFTFLWITLATFSIACNCNLFISLRNPYKPVFYCQYQEVLGWTNLLALVCRFIFLPTEALSSSFVFVSDSWKRQRVDTTAIYFVSFCWLEFSNEFYSIYLQFLHWSSQTYEESTRQPE